MKMSTAQWISWLGATLVAAVMLCGFVYATFETKAESKDHRDTLQIQLDKMDIKLDKIDDKVDRVYKSVK